MRVPKNKTMLWPTLIVLVLPLLTAASPSSQSRAEPADASTARGHAAARAPKPGPEPKTPQGYEPYKGSGKETAGGSAAAVVAAYVLVWMILLLYLLRLWNRQKRLEKELDELTRRQGEREGGPDRNGSQTPGGKP